MMNNLVLTKEKAKESIKNYNELSNIVYNYKGSVEELCDKLGGYNVQNDYESFDINFKTITATIYNNNTFSVYEYIDIWDDEEEMMVSECINIYDVLKMLDLTLDK